jgi:prepilin-type N-terminal cleavage/methylation domain-containing protein
MFVCAKKQVLYKFLSKGIDSSKEISRVMKRGANTVNRVRLWSHPRQKLANRGVTLAEALITIVVVGVLSAIAAPNVMRTGSKPLPDTANQVAAVLRASRARAIAQTSPIKVRPLGRSANSNGTSTGGSNSQLEILRATSTNTVCNSEVGWTVDNSFSSDYLTFAQAKSPNASVPLVILQSTQVDGAALSVATGWEICFNTRGIASTTTTSTTNFQGNGVVLTLQQVSDSKTQRVELFPAGGIQVYDN